MSTERVAYVVDDEEIVRRSLVMLLRSAGFDATAFASGQAFLDATAKGLPFGCVLLDLRMPDMDGLAVQQEILARGLEMPVIMVTAHGDVPQAVAAMKYGASDFIEKPYDSEALLQAVDRALSRGAEALARSRETSEAAGRVALLSAREREVLERLVEGRQNKEIARDLGLSPRTVEIHRANVMEKLAVRGLSEAVRIALAAGVGRVAPGV